MLAALLVSATARADQPERPGEAPSAPDTARPAADARRAPSLIAVRTDRPPDIDGHYSRVTAANATGVNPLLTLDSFHDATLPSGVTSTDFRDGEVNVNLFVRWEYMPLSALWLVYIRNQQQVPYDPMEGPGKIRFDRFSGGPTVDVILLKLSYLWF